MSTDNPLPGSGQGVDSATGFTGVATDTTLSELLITLRKRKLVLITAIVLGMLLGFYKAVRQVKLYEASGRIQVRSGSSNQFKLETSAFFGEDDPLRKQQTEIAIITSDTLLATVGRDLNLANNPDFTGDPNAKGHRSMDDPATRQFVVEALRNGLSVAPVGKTDLIRISYTSLNAKLSALVVNTIIDDYVQHSYETRFESSQVVSKWLSSQLDDLKQQVEGSQSQVMDLQKKLGALGFDNTHNQISTTLDDLAKAAGTAKIARIIAESRYRLVAGMDPNSMVSSSETAPGQSPPELTSLRSSLATAQANYAELTATLGPNHPSVKAAKAEMDALSKSISAEQSRLVTQSRSDYELAKANEDKTDAALEQEKQQAYQLRDDLVDYTIRQRDFEANRTLYEGLLQKLRTAGIEAGLEATEIDTVDRAVAPLDPLLKPTPQIVLTYVAIGLVIGVLLAFILESLDTGLRSVAEIENITELPSLAIIPKARRATADQISTLSIVERNINVLTQPKSQFTEAFRSLRTALLLSTPGREPKLILFTSATPSEGKTTAACNLAVILAQSGNRILLVDADLRRPNVHHRFGLNGKLGLTTILSGQSSLIDAIQRVKEVPSLDVLASGPVPPFPTEMLNSQAMEEIIRQAARCTPTSSSIRRQSSPSPTACCCRARSTP